MTQINAALRAIAFREAEARSRRLGIIERPGAMPPAYAESGGASALRHIEAIATDRTILRALAERPMIVSEIAAATGILPKTISGRMQQIKLAGRCTYTKVRKGQVGGAWHRYAITAKGRAFIAEAETSAVQRDEAENHMAAYPEPEKPLAGKSEGSALKTVHYVTRFDTMAADRGYIEKRVSLADGVGQGVRG